MPVIELVGLEKKYKLGAFHQKRVHAVKGVDLTIDRGEVFGFVGPNGAGKSTVIKMLVGLLVPTAGYATILGRRLPNRKVQASIGFLPETPSFYAYLTGLELLDFYGKLLGMSAADRAARIPETVERVGMAGRADRPIRKFSKGMIQRIGLAQALLNRPDIIVLDEPMSGLDPVGRRDIREIILQERSRGATVFFSSHILSDVEELCDRVGILVDGRLKSVGTIEEIRSARLLGMEVVVAGWSGEGLDSWPGVREIRHRGQLSTIITSPDVDIDGLIRRLLDHGGHLVEVRRNTQSLEEYFMEEADR